MTIDSIEEKWKLLNPESKGGFLSLRISPDCVPDLFIGLDSIGTRCLILKLPSKYENNILSITKQNLSLEFYKETSWIILKLSNSIYQDIFNDLIVSLYLKIKGIAVVSEYFTVFLETFHKWNDFFEDGCYEKLSEQLIKGLIGEILFLMELIKESNPAIINEVLKSWTGPFDTGHDFILNDKNFEVKTRDNNSVTIHISSEYQLEPELGKPLELVVVNLNKDSAGLCLREILNNMRKLVIARNGDYTIILKALSQKGVTISNISEYDNFRYLPMNIKLFDCIHRDFPKIIRSELNDLINTVSYNIRIAPLDIFLIKTIELNGN